jgi:hypothetical protein
MASENAKGPQGFMGYLADEEISAFQKDKLIKLRDSLLVERKRLKRVLEYCENLGVMIPSDVLDVNVALPVPRPIVGAQLKFEKSERNEKFDKMDKSEKSERSEKIDKSDRSDKSEKTPKTERSEIKKKLSRVHEDVEQCISMIKTTIENGKNFERKNALIRCVLTGQLVTVANFLQVTPKSELNEMFLPFNASNSALSRNEAFAFLSDYITKQDISVLHLACTLPDSYDITHLLLKNGVAVSCQSSPFSPLHVASLYSNVESIELLISYGAVTNEITQFNITQNATPLQLARARTKSNTQRTVYGYLKSITVSQGGQNKATLSLSKHHLTRIPREVLSLTTLTSLDLTRNLFQTLPISLLQLEKLQSVDMKGCPLTLIPPSLRTSNLIHTFRQIVQNKLMLHWPYVKCIVLGYSTKHKSALIRLICSELAAATEQTTTPLTPPQPSTTSSRSFTTSPEPHLEVTDAYLVLSKSHFVHISFYDFDDYAITHSLYRPFCTNNTIYLVIFDGIHHMFEYENLLSSLHFYVAVPWVITVATEDESELDRMQNQMNQNFVCISSHRLRDGAVAILSLIRSFCMKSPFFKKKYPASFILFLHYLKCLRQGLSLNPVMSSPITMKSDSYIDYSHLTLLAKASHISESQLTAVLEYAHSTGVLFYNPPRPDDSPVFLDSQMLLSYVTATIDVCQTKFSPSLIAEAEEYLQLIEPRSLHIYLTEFMQNNDFLYRLSSIGQSYGLLPTSFSHEREGEKLLIKENSFLAHSQETFSHSGSRLMSENDGVKSNSPLVLDGCTSPLSFAAINKNHGFSGTDISSQSLKRHAWAKGSFTSSDSSTKGSRLKGAMLDRFRNSTQNSSTPSTSSSSSSCSSFSSSSSSSTTALSVTSSSSQATTPNILISHSASIELLQENSSQLIEDATENYSHKMTVKKSNSKPQLSFPPSRRSLSPTTSSNTSTTRYSLFEQQKTRQKVAPNSAQQDRFTTMSVVDKRPNSPSNPKKPNPATLGEFSVVFLNTGLSGYMSRFGIRISNNSTLGELMKVSITKRHMFETIDEDECCFSIKGYSERLDLSSKVSELPTNELMLKTRKETELSKGFIFVYSGLPTSTPPEMYDFLMSVSAHKLRRHYEVRQGALDDSIISLLLARLISNTQLEYCYLHQRGVVVYHPLTMEYGLILKESRTQLSITVWTKRKNRLASIIDFHVAMTFFSFPKVNYEMIFLCSHCHLFGPPGTDLHKVTSFTFKEIISAIMNGQPLLCKDTKVLVDRIVPDFLFSRNDIVLNSQDVVCHEMVGEGGHCKVFRGEYFGESVAVKKFSTEISSYGYEQFLLFHRETCIMQNLSHPNIVKMVGVSIIPLLVVMEFVTGGDLQSILNMRLRVMLQNVENTPYSKFKEEELLLICHEVSENWGDNWIFEMSDGFRMRIPSSITYKVNRYPITKSILSWRLRLKIATDIALGMEYLHSLTPPLAHRDLRSPNICVVNLDPDSEVTIKIMDFGLSDLLSTRTKERLKTWQWAAPEVLKQEEHKPVLFYDISCDVYSFGIVLNEIAARKCPFIDDYWDTHCTNDRLRWRSSFSCITEILNGDLRPIIPSHTPTPYANLIRECWDREAYRRPTFASIVKTLQAISKQVELFSVADMQDEECDEWQKTKENQIPNHEVLLRLRKSFSFSRKRGMRQLVRQSRNSRQNSYGKQMMEFFSVMLQNLGRKVTGELRFYLQHDVSFDFVLDNGRHLCFSLPPFEMSSTVELGSFSSHTLRHHHRTSSHIFPHRLLLAANGVMGLTQLTHTIAIPSSSSSSSSSPKTYRTTIFTNLSHTFILRHFFTSNPLFDFRNRFLCVSASLHEKQIDFWVIENQYPFVTHLSYLVLSTPIIELNCRFSVSHDIAEVWVQSQKVITLIAVRDLFRGKGVEIFSWPIASSPRSVTNLTESIQIMKFMSQNRSLNSDTVRPFLVSEHRCHLSLNYLVRRHLHFFSSNRESLHQKLLILTQKSRSPSLPSSSPQSSRTPSPQSTSPHSSSPHSSSPQSTSPSLQGFLPAHRSTNASQNPQALISPRYLSPPQPTFLSRTNTSSSPVLRVRRPRVSAETFKK